MKRLEMTASSALGFPDETGATATDSPHLHGQRLPYEKPALRTLHLAAEEVLAVGCKLAGGPGGPIGASCTSSSCFSAGS